MRRLQNRPGSAAGSLQGRFRIGTAAWSNPPAQKSTRPSECSHLEHYASRFNSVEINSSFYRPHQHSTYIRWRDSTPAGFAFAVKAPRAITHECALRHYRGELRQFLDQVSGLGSKLHVLLVQLPPDLEFESGVARRFFQSLAAASASSVACEPRHPSWFSQSAENLLRRLDIARVAADPGRSPTAHLPGGSKKQVYYRLHGSPRMYYSGYSSAYLSQLATHMKSLSARTREVWCIFDNTARHEAWPNARELARLVVPA